jgi:hypothetical protein
MAGQKYETCRFVVSWLDVMSVHVTARVEMLFQRHTPLGQRFWDRLRLAQSFLSTSHPVYQQHETKTYNLTRDEILFKYRICLPFK